MNPNEITTAGRMSQGANSDVRKITFSYSLARFGKSSTDNRPALSRVCGAVEGKDFAAQFKLRDNSQGRCFYFKNGKVTSKSGVHPADVVMSFQSAELAASIMKPNRNQLDFLHAVKNFQIEVQGPDELAIWLAETLNMLLTAGVEYGTSPGSGVKRFTNNTNGGPVFVDVKDDKIIRITPIEFDESDAQPWTIEAHGQEVYAAAQDDRQPRTRWRGSRWSIRKTACSIR